MNTVLVYQYRDASNYKTAMALTLEGWVGPLEEFMKHTSPEDEGSFLPGQVGLEHLQQRMISFPTEDDHVWHELLDIESTEAKPTEPVIQADKILQAMKQACKEGWDVRAEMKRAGIPE